MKNFLLTLTIMLFVSGCSSNGIEREYVDGVLVVHNPENGLWQDEPEPPISFELEQTFGQENEPADEIFSSITFIQTDQDGNVYVFDRQGNRLAVFGPGGNFLRSKGRAGQGPGEFNMVMGMIYDGDNSLYISNSGGMQLDRFDLNGNYQTSFRLNNYDIDRAFVRVFLPPNICVLTHNDTEEGRLDIHLVEVTDSLNVRTTITVEEELEDADPIIASQGFSTGVIADNIVVTGIEKYAFHYYTIDGNLQKTVMRDFDELMRPGIFRNETMIRARGNGGLSAPKRLSGDYEISIATWPVNLSHPDQYLEGNPNDEAPEIKYQNSVDLFNTNGELLYSLVSDGYYPEIGNLAHVDSDGKLYTIVSEPFPQVRRYAVRINK